MIDELNVIKIFRAVLLNAELVTLKATGDKETVAIRDGDYDPVKHTRPTDPVITEVIDPDDLEVKERKFDPNGKDLYVSETYLPAADVPVANTVEMLGGIMQYSVYVPVKGANGHDVTALRNMAKYIKEVFNPELPLLDTGGYYNISLVIDEATPAPAIIGEAWVSVPVSISFRNFNENQP